MKKRSAVLIGIITFCLTGFIVQKEKPLPVYSSSAVEEDLRLLKKELEAKHPGLYQYRSKAEIKRMFDSCVNNVYGIKDGLQVYSSVMWMISQIGDGSIYATPPMEVLPDSMRTAVYFPAKLLFQGEKAYVIQSYKNQLPDSSEVVSINGKLIKDLIPEMTAFIPGDGKIKTGKLRQLNDRFAYQYNMIYGQQATHDVEYIGPDFMTSFAKVKSIIKGKLDSLSRTDDFQSPEKLLSIKYDGKIGILTIRSLEHETIKAAGENLPAFLSKTFTELEKNKTGNLIVDLRGCEGNTDIYGSLLYSYFNSVRFTMYRNLIVTSKDLPYGDFGALAGYYIRMNEKMIDSVSPREWVVKPEAHPNLAPINKAPQFYKGKVFIITDGNTRAVATDFCAMMKGMARATFIGEETGGTAEGRSGGVYSLIVLPNTKTKVYIPRVLYGMNLRAPKESGRGIMPDHGVEPFIIDVIKGNDVQMQTALELAKKLR